MKFTLSWLKEHLDTDEPLETIADKLTMIGLEVEAVEDKAKKFGAFTVASVISAEKHPNADKLRVCMVDTGSGAPVQVVCGAPNARAGMRGVFAPPGTHIPGTGLDLKVAMVRGVESRGMLLSERELGLSDEHTGIIDLPADMPVGKRFAEVLGLDDPVIDVAVTPNRPDCNGVHGIARDLAAAGTGTFKDASITPVPGVFLCPVAVKLDFADTPPLCPAFGLRLIKGVKNGPSPDWLQRRLLAIGLRPINTLVDITNLITYDRARPLHVFDAAKVHGHLVVRRARSGETFLALDGKTYTLDESMCVIADDKGVESLAGIMGGEETGCSETTRDVLIESALWVPQNIAQTGRRLGIHSDARYRFADHVIDFPVTEVKRLAGLEITLPEMKDVLGRLGFSVAGSGEMVKIARPSWRPDVEGKADIVEEIVRIEGVDRVPSAPFDRGDVPRKPVLTGMQVRTRKAKRALGARGLVEAVTWSFIANAQAEMFGGGQPELTLANPIAADLSDMRPSIVPSLVIAAQKNADRGFSDVGLFEVGQIFKGDRPDDQLTAATGVRRALAKPYGAGRHWSNRAAEVDAFDVKADAVAVLAAVGAPMQALQIVPGGPPWLHPRRSGTIQIGAHNVLGHFGELHPRALEALGAEGPLVAFEVVLDRIPEPKAKPTCAKPVLDLPPFQPVERDFAFLVDRAVRAGDIVAAAQRADRKLVSGVTVFDVYEGQGIEPGKKSVAIAVMLQPRERTMTDEEIESVSAKIVAEVNKRTGGVLRA